MKSLKYTTNYRSYCKVTHWHHLNVENSLSTFFSEREWGRDEGVSNVTALIDENMIDSKNLTSREATKIFGFIGDRFSKNNLLLFVYDS